MEKEILDTAVTDFGLVIGLLVRRMRFADTAHEFSWTETAVMARLAKEGPMTISDLARAERMRPQSMSGVVAVLDEMQLVERRPHPTDGRQIHIVLTEKGTTVRDQHLTARRTWLAESISRLNEQEQQTLFKASNILRGLVEL